MPRWWLAFLRSAKGKSAGFEVEERRRGLVIDAAVPVTDEDAADGCEDARVVADKQRPGGLAHEDFLLGSDEEGEI
jgi:hypothetical protein